MLLYFQVFIYFKFKFLIFFSILLLLFRKKGILIAGALFYKTVYLKSKLKKISSIVKGKTFRHNIKEYL